MLKFWEKILWFLLVMSCIAVIVYFVWMFESRYTVPKLLLFSILAYLFLFLVYLSIKWILREKEQKQTEIKNKLEATYKQIQQMSAEQKNEFVLSEATVIYFENVELLKNKLTPDELSKYKKVLYGTEDPYIVTEEGRIVVKAYPGNFLEKD